MWMLSPCLVAASSASTSCMQTHVKVSTSSFNRPVKIPRETGDRGRHYFVLVIFRSNIVPS